MELRHLRYFHEIARELSYSRAARKLHVAQPALSMRMRDLEQELGVELFRRVGSRIELTSAGTVLLAHVHQILDGIETAVDLTRRAGSGNQLALQVGFIGSASYSFLPVALRAFRDGFPGVDLRLQEMSTPRQVEALLAGRLDVGLLRLPIEAPSIAVAVVHREPFVVALPASHRLANSRSISPKLLLNEDFILFPPDQHAGFHHQVRMICQKAGFAPRVVQYAMPMQNVIGLVDTGLGVAIVPRSVEKIRADAVVYRPLAVTQPLAETAVAWTRENVDATVQAFIRAVQEAGASHSQPAVTRGARDPD